MKKIKLMNLTLRNFKGIKDFTLNANGENVRIYGENATGKTSLFDAMTWLLFDKDSNNRSDFQIKTVDDSGNEIHGLEHEVEAIFQVDGEELTLKKVYKEKWTKKRGSATSTFTGHETDYHIDAVPVKQKEFKQKVSEIVDEDIFKLVTNPAYFNEKLKWQDRRKTLIDVCGDISDEDVIESNKKLKKLSGILGQRSVDDHKKVIAGKKKEINKELESIPVRIDEIQRNLPDTNGLVKDKLQDQIEKATQFIRDKEDELSRIRNGAEAAEKQVKLSELKNELIEIKNNHNEKIHNQTSGMKKHFYNLRSQRDKAESGLHAIEREISQNHFKKQSAEEQAEALREKWFTVNHRPFAEEPHLNHDENCPTCGQSLPADEVEEAHRKAKEAHEKRLSEFNRRKASELESIQEQGKQAKKSADELAAKNKELQEKYRKSRADFDSLEKEITNLESEIAKIELAATNVEDTAPYKEKAEKINQVNVEIRNLSESKDQEILAVDQQIDEKRQEVREINQKLSLFDQRESSEKRIAELTERERELAKQFEELEHELFLTEEFIRSKVDLLEEKINSKFKMARFKLFENQINDGLKETCETIYQGVPYSKGLNNAARINIGLDIIDTLSEHYQFQAPIFVDNAEAVTKLIDVDAQLIGLVVSEADKTLRIEN